MDVGHLAASCTEHVPKQYKPFEIRVDVSNAVRKHIEFMKMCLTAICEEVSENLSNRLELVHKNKYPDRNSVPTVNKGHEDFGATINLKMNIFESILFSFDIPADCW